MIDISVGASQGTKLGPILWLFYIEDLEVDNFSMVKYADDTSFYTTIHNMQTELYLLDESWSDQNFMSLNADKTDIMNILIKRSLLMESILSPRNHLIFSDHVDKLVSDCDKRLYSLRQLKV